MTLTTSTSKLTCAAAAAGLGAGLYGARQTVPPSLYIAKPPADAARAILDVASVVAEDGNWKNIYVGRTYLLGGMKAEGEQILQRVAMSKKVKASDYHNLNGDRTKAEELFGRAFAKPTGNPYNVAKAAGSYLGVTPQ